MSANVRGKEAQVRRLEGTKWLRLLREKGGSYREPGLAAAETRFGLTFVRSTVKRGKPSIVRDYSLPRYMYAFAFSAMQELDDATVHRA